MRERIARIAVFCVISVTWPSKGSDPQLDLAIRNDFKMIGPGIHYKSNKLSEPQRAGFSLRLELLLLLGSLSFILVIKNKDLNQVQNQQKSWNQIGSRITESADPQKGSGQKMV
jgi:hypothetical protein